MSSASASELSPLRTLCVVAIGGGTGLSALRHGLKRYVPAPTGAVRHGSERPPPAKTFVRVGILDDASRKWGTLEIPDAGAVK